MSTSLIVPRDIAVRMLDQACATCRFSNKDQTGDRNCRRNPPQSSILLVPNKLGQLMPQPFSTFPIVRDDFWCGEWKERGNGRAAD